MKCKLCCSNRTIKKQVFAANFIKKYYNINLDRFFAGDFFYEYKCLDCDLKSFDKVTPGDSDFYDFLQELPLYYEENKQEFDYALKKIALINPQKILEIGAGRGFFLEKLKDAYDVYASEFSKKSISILKNKEIQLDQQNITYDFICSFQVFEHIDNLSELLNFCDKKLNKEGYLLITVPNNDSQYFMETFDVLDFPPHHMHQFSEIALKNIAKKLNYTIEDYWVEPLRIEHYFSIIRARRDKIMSRFLFMKKLFLVIDFALTPYYYKLESSSSKGHTHGLLMKKNF